MIFLNLFESSLHFTQTCLCFCDEAVASTFSEINNILFDMSDFMNSVLEKFRFTRKPPQSSPFLSSVFGESHLSPAVVEWLTWPPVIVFAYLCAVLCTYKHFAEFVCFNCVTLDEFFV